MDWKRFFYGTDSLPGTKITHARLGDMVFEDPFWRGHVAVGDVKLEILIDDDGKGINEILADYCFSVVSNFEDFLNDSVGLMSSELKLSTTEVLTRFSPTDLWGFFKGKEKRHFYISFRDRNNESARWSVQFDNEIASHAGCDT